MPYSAPKNSLSSTACESYNLISVLKFIFAFFIVAIHTRPLTFLDATADFILVDYICRAAVPFYFACSGFFFFRKIRFENGKIKKCKENSSRLRRYFLRILILYAVWSAVYLVYQLIRDFPSGITFAGVKGYLVSLFVGGTYFHLWYLLCLVYAIPALYLLLRLVKVSRLPIIAVLLWCVGAVTYAYGHLSSYFAPMGYICRAAEALGCLWTFLFRALPLLSVGVAVAKLRRLPASADLVLFVLCAIGLLGEVLFKRRVGSDDNYSYMFFTYPVAYFLFSLVERSSLFGKREMRSERYFRNMSTVIYCVHPLFLIILFGFSDNSGVISFVAVSLLSVVFSYLIVFLSRRKHFGFLKYVY